MIVSFGFALQVRAREGIYKNHVSSSGTCGQGKGLSQILGLVGSQVIDIVSLLKRSSFFFFRRFLQYWYSVTVVSERR